jgi:acyl-CoA thioester hydrolase
MRIRIDLPEHFHFATEIPVFIGHINYGGHLDNALLLSIVSEARLRFLKSLGYTELDIEGVGTVVADAAVQYKAEAFHGDLLSVRLAAVNFDRKCFDFYWQMVDGASGREVARGKTGVVFFDYAARRVTEVPAAFLRAIAGLDPIEAGEPERKAA